mmetsp:Transcript_24342/g.57103  ORF Transcript_24342/g.57103 Transcript_24342/m.57103 type:complete len:253 (-) Transcript_24342:206-964(-)
MDLQPSCSDNRPSSRLFALFFALVSLMRSSMLLLLPLQEFQHTPFGRGATARGQKEGSSSLGINLGNRGRFQLPKVLHHFQRRSPARSSVQGCPAFHVSFPNRLGPSFRQILNRFQLRLEVSRQMKWQHSILSWKPNGLWVESNQEFQHWLARVKRTRIMQRRGQIGTLSVAQGLGKGLVHLAQDLHRRLQTSQNGQGVEHALGAQIPINFKAPLAQPRKLENQLVNGVKVDWFVATRGVVVEIAKVGQLRR